MPDLDLDDRKAMEDSAFQAFIGPEQADFLIMLWQNGERRDNEWFERKFGDPNLGLDTDPDS